MSKDFDIHNNKRTDKIYVSKRFESINPIDENTIKTRQITKVFDVSDFHFFEYLKDYKTIVLRKTEKEREEVKIIVIENWKNVIWISIQRFMVKTWYPKAESFFLRPEEFWKMIDLLKSIEFIDFSSPSHFQITDEELRKNTSELIKLVEKIPNWKVDKETLILLLNKITKDDKISTLISSLSDDEKNLLSTNHIEIKRRRILEELKDRLAKIYHETIWDDSWQKWISTNCWLIWASYIKPIEKQKINITWIMPDYLYPTHDWFVDILEIKLPKDEVIKDDSSSHAGSWIWTTETNKAIWQVVNYLWEIDRQRLEIEKNVLEKYNKKISFLKPRAFILIWNDDLWYKWEENEKIKRDIKLEALKKLNWTLHWIEIITYSELLRRWQTFIWE